ncbi:hypothetical protein DCAR_0206715 [Daucus carota subsp. sativus]|uniref:Metallothionein-like protein n=1 Tax=Daucus carota subsp. sativus TaxID=79200 RepID=A0AAF0WG22_DAUCS|nr:hypothetical protein DCAR_0206715 [Daucus carota subsp. sativus]
MSSCGSNCSCGSDCKCGSNGGKKRYSSCCSTYDGAKKSFGEGGNACKCGSSCTCDPCNC